MTTEATTVIFDFGKKKRRRRQLRERPLDPAQTAVLQRVVPGWRRLSEEQRRRLGGLVQIFLAEKTFEGCGGQRITDEIRLTIAGTACLLLLGRETGVFDALDSVLVYPASFVVDHEEVGPDGVVRREEQEMLGESWRDGALVLSWEDIETDLAERGCGCNVILHEFTHQLDDESGEADGTPLLADGAHYADWHRVLGAHFDALCAAVEAGEETFLDEYGSESPTEFFAVATETFFELPRQLRRHHPELYSQLNTFYEVDPAL